MCKWRSFITCVPLPLPPPKYHVTLRACKDGGYREKSLMREKIINQIFQKLQKNPFKNLPLLCAFVRRISSLLDTSIVMFFISNNVELLLKQIF